MAQTINKQRFISFHRLARTVCTVLLATLVQAAAARSPHVARIVADPNAESQHRPTILSTADGLPLINIQTPNDQGLSKNDYIQFDADRGLSWNNHRIQNPHLLARSARTILNQVNSSHPSYLKGPLTVLGDRAQVIIANPSGLYCEGCGFINVHRATLTTGTPIINKNGHLDGYRVQHGLISVQGSGLQSSKTDYTELIARAVLINDQLQANQLKIITGANLVSGDVVTPLQQPASSAPVLAIDVAELGGLYANKIKLIGTEAGVGVRNAGHIGLEAGQIKITVNGFLDNSGEIDSRRPARSKTAPGATQGSVRHEGMLDITTRGPLINRGMLTAHGHTTLHTGSARLNNSGQIATMNDLSIASADLNNSKGSIKAVGRLRAQVPGKINNQAGLIHSTSVVHLITDRLDNSNTQGRERGLQGKTLTINANVIKNKTGAMRANKALSLDGTAHGRVDNSAGLIHSNGMLRVTTGNLNNANTRSGERGLQGKTVTLMTDSMQNKKGAIRANQSLCLDGAKNGVVNNTAGVMYAKGKLRVTTGQLDNTHTHNGARGLAGKTVTLITDSIKNKRGAMRADEFLALDGTERGTVDNPTGLIRSKGTLRMTMGALNNTNTQGSEHGVAGKKVTIQADSINNQVGSIQTDGALTLIGTTQIDNRLGSISSRQAVALQALAGTSPADKRLSILNTGGTVLAGTKLTVDSQSLSGDGQIHSNEQLDIKLLNDLHNVGKITAGGDATLSLTGALHNRQTLDAGHRLTVSAASIDNTSTGEINAGHTELVALESLTNRGLINGDETLIQADKVNNLGTGRIYGDHIAIGATTLDNGAETVHGVTSAANVSARKRLDIGVQSLTNREHGLLGSEGNFALGRALDGHHRAIGQAEKFDNSSATLEALGDLNLTVDTLNNTNAHFTLKTVPVGEPSRAILIQPEGDPNRYPEHHFVWEGWSRAGQYRHQNWEVTRFTKYDVMRTETQSVVNRSDPGKIVAGGDLRLSGRDLNNDKSQLIAGGRITGDLSNLRNLEAEGARTVQEAGSSQYSTPRYRGRWKNYHTRDWHHPIPYTPADEIHTITVPMTKVLEHTQSTRSGAQTPALSRNLEEVSIRTPSDIPGHPGTMMRTQMPAITLPNHTLFRHNPKPDSLTLIETDPHLTRSHKKLDAEYMLKRMAQNPAIVQKRLGDGFYEQRLVGEQINQLTGRRFLHNHTNDEVQYRALMEQGLHFADQLKLRPGIALSAAQMAQLTSDIVWPVQREVALADGTVQKVLVPQVYAYVKEGDLKGDGTLISGRALKLSMRQDMMNKGTMAGRTKVNVDAEEIKNLGGKITGGETILHARTDLDNHGGALTGDTHLVVRADRDLNLLSTTQQGAKTAGASHFSRTHLDRVASLTSHGSLSASAGRDATFTAAEINNTSPDNQTTLTAGHNLNLGALTVGYQENMVGDANNFLKQGLSDEIGSTIQTVGNLQLAAGHNFTAKAANLTSQQGALTATAEHNVTISAGQTQHNFDEGHSHTRRGLFSSSSSATRETINQTQASGSLLSGNTVKIKSGQNLTVHGSDVVANQQVSLAAEGDIHLSAAQNTASHSHQSQQHKSGLLNGGGVGIMIGSQTQHDQAGEREITHTDSTIASLTGDVTIVSGKDTQLKASGVYAGRDLNVTGQNITLDNVHDVLAQSERHTFEQSGLSIGLGGEIVEKARAIYRHMDRASKVKDPRLKAVKQAQAVYALDQLSSAAVTGSASGTQGAAGGKSVRLELSIGSSQSENEAHTKQTTARGANLVANRRVNIMATGDGHAKSGDLTVKGSQIKGKEVNLAARHDLVFESVANTGHHQSKQNSSGFTAGVGVSLGQQSGLALFASGQVANGHADGKSAQYANSSVIATDTLTLTSGRDATLTGAQLSGQKIKAEIGRNLTLTSQQDSDAYHQGQTNLSAGLSGVLGAGGVSGGLAVSRGQVKSRYASVNLPTGLIAGKEGFEIQVGKHTQLNGAQIANAAPSKSVLNTDTLGFTDLQNKAQYEARSSGFSASYGGAASAKQNIVANSLANVPSGLGLTGTQGAASSTTQAAISPARIEVRRDQETGQDSTQGLKRDTQNAHQTLQKIFDLQEVQEKIELGREAANLGMQVSGDLANKLAAQNPDSKLWGEGQLGRIGLHAAVAGLGAQMTGGNVGGAIAGTVAGDLASSKVSARVNQAMAGMTNPNAKQTVSNVVTNLLAGTTGAIVGGAVGGQSGALAGAGGALAADQFNRQLHPDEKNIIHEHLAKIYSSKHADITEQQAAGRLEVQLERMVNAESGRDGQWDTQAAAYLEAYRYKALYAGVKVGYDQWGDAVPMFGNASGYQRTDSTIFSAIPQTIIPPSNLGLQQVSDYVKGIADGIWNTTSHPIDTLAGVGKGLYDIVTRPKEAANRMQSQVGHALDQAGEGNFRLAGEQFGHQVGTTAVTTAVSIRGVTGAIAGVNYAGVKTGLAVPTPYGLAWQSLSPKALALRGPIAKGAPVFRSGTTGLSEAVEAQFWAIENPLTTSNYGLRYGIPKQNIERVNFVERGLVNSGGHFVVRPAPGLQGNTGGAFEVVVPSAGVKAEFFSTIGGKK